MRWFRRKPKPELLHPRAWVALCNRLAERDERPVIRPGQIQKSRPASVAMAAVSVLPSCTRNEAVTCGVGVVILLVIGLSLLGWIVSAAIERGERASENEGGEL